MLFYADCIPHSPDSGARRSRAVTYTPLRNCSLLNKLRRQCELSSDGQRCLNKWPNSVSARWFHSSIRVFRLI